MQLLGRSIDLNRLIGQQVGTTLQSSLNVAISRFEAGDLTGVMVGSLPSSFVLVWFWSLVLTQYGLVQLVLQLDFTFP